MVNKMKSKIYTLELDWPSANLSPNSRGHWTKKAKSAKLAKQAAYVACKAAKFKLGRYPSLEVVFHPPQNRRQDVDNMLARLKPYIDGIALATGVDDSEFHIHPFRGEVVKGGVVLITAQWGKSVPIRLYKNKNEEKNDTSNH